MSEVENMLIEGQAIPSILVGDIVRQGKSFWEIDGIYLGAEGQESVVSMIPIGKTPNPNGQVLIPIDFISGKVLRCVGLSPWNAQPVRGLNERQRNE